MNERVVEILVYIMDQIQSNKASLNQLEAFSQDLLNRGYTQNEISSAFSWLIEKIQSNFDEVVHNEGPISSFSFRVLHELEQMVISPEAYGYILQLKELGLLDDTGVEQVIERAMMIGATQLDLFEIKSIVATVISPQMGMLGGGLFLSDDEPMIH